MSPNGKESSGLVRWLPAFGGLALGLGIAVFVAAKHEHRPAAVAAPAPTRAPVAPPPPAPAKRCEAPIGKFAETVELALFLRGNVHTHTNWSDGDVSPERVIEWYRDAKYDFLAITDHNGLTNPDVFKGSAGRRLILIPGEEITYTSNKRPVHVNALCTKKVIGSRLAFPTNADALGAAIASVHAQGGVAIVNHPNYEWALAPADVLGAKSADLLEVWSGHPFVHSEGDEGRPSHVAIWDQALRLGIRFGAVAVDDSHHFRTNGKGNPARPGRAWIWVAADRSRGAVCDALREKKLYASHGPEIDRIKVDVRTFTVATKEARTIEFWGGKSCDGKQATTTELLAKMTATKEATYTLRGGETYVRAEVKDDDGKAAWTQAYLVGSP